jgi:Resolvase, N terminal domain
MVGMRLAVDGYVRVSKVGCRHGERFISPDVQRQRINDWTSLAGCRLLEVFNKLDESGGRADRPVLERVIRRAEDGISPRRRRRASGPVRQVTAGRVGGNQAHPGRGWAIRVGA